MKGVLKDLGILFFSAGEEIEKKAQEYRAKREERYRAFAEKIASGDKEKKTGFAEQFAWLKERFSALSSSFGFATKDELRELKEMIIELQKKIDNKN